MADYSLGTAHGRIVVEYDDHGTKQAQVDFEAVANRAGWLGQRLRQLGSDVSYFANGFRSDMAGVAASARDLMIAAGLIGLVTGQVTRLGRGLFGLRGTIGVLGSLGTLIGGLPNSVANFPNIIKQFILMAAAIQLLQSSTRVISGFLSRTQRLGGLAGPVRAVGDAVNYLGRPITRIANLALAFGSLLVGVRVARQVTTAVMSMVGAFGGIYGVIAAIGGLVAALGQLSGVLGLIPGAAFAVAAALGTIAVGFQGFRDALRFVPPASAAASGGMNQTAVAARNAARQIAAAQRGIEDALRDQARTVRDTARAVVDAQEQLAQAYEQAAEAAERAARSVEDAQRSLADAIQQAGRDAIASARAVSDAQRNLARTVESSARAVQNASRSLASAMRSEADAQRNLNRTRAEALEQLQELQERTKDLALDQEGAAIALIEAQQNLERVNNDALSNDLDRRKAAYELAVAQRRLETTNKDAADASKEYAEAAEAGVDGNQAVIDANQALIDSRQAVIDATQEFMLAERDASEANAMAARDLADAEDAAAQDRIDSERRVADARRQLSDAYTDQARTARDNARSIQDAQESLAIAEESAAEARADAARRVDDAYRQMRETQEDVAQSMAQAAAAASGAEDPINKLSPAAQALVRTLRGLRDEWDALTHSVQDALFVNIAGDIESLAGTYLPLLEKGLVGIASAFNQAYFHASAFLREAQTQTDLAAGFELVRQILVNLNGAIQPILRALRDIGIVGLEALEELSRAVAPAAAEFANFIAQARASGELRAWIDRAIQGFRDLWAIVRDVGASLNLIFQGLTGGDGGDFLAFLADAAARMRAFLESARGQEVLRTLGEVLRVAAEVGLQVFTAAVDYLVPAILALSPLFIDLARVIGTVLATAISIIGPMLEGFFTTLSFFSPVIAPIIGGFLSIGIAARTLSATFGVLSVVFGTLGTGIRLVWSTITGFGTAIGFLVKHAGFLRTAFQGVVTAFNVLKIAFMANPWLLLIGAIIALVALIILNWDQIMAYLDTAWKWIQDTANAIFGPLFEWLGGAWESIVTSWNEAWEGLGRFLDDTWNNISTGWNDFWGGVGETFESSSASLAEGWNTFWDDTATFATDAWNGMSETWAGVLEWFLGIFGTNSEELGKMWNDFWAGVGEFFTNLTNDIDRIWEDAWNGIINFFSSAGNTLWNTAAKIATDILNAFWNLPNSLYNIGQDIVRGIGDGIGSMGRWLWDTVSNFARRFIPGPIADALGIASPSKLMREEIGKMVPRGIMLGFEDEAGALAASARRMVGGVVDAATAAGNTARIGATLAQGLPVDSLISGATAATAARTAAAMSVPAAAATAATGPVEEAERIIEELHLHITGNLDPTNKVNWDKAIDSIRDGIRTRERIRK